MQEITKKYYFYVDVCKPYSEGQEFSILEGSFESEQEARRRLRLVEVEYDYVVTGGRVFTDD